MQFLPSQSRNEIIEIEAEKHLNRILEERSNELKKLRNELKHSKDRGKKQRIEKKIQKLPKARIDALAKRLLPKVKQAERERFANKATDNPTTPKKESVMPSFKDFLNEKIKVKQDKDIKDREGTQPAKYYAKDAEGDKMSKATKQARARHFAKYGKKNDDMDKNYKPAPGDAGGKTKPSVHTKKYQQMFGKESVDKLNEKIDGLVKKADKSGMPYSVLKKVYDRGMAAWKTGHRPGTTPQQWGYARVNAFIVKKKKGNLNHDKDLA